MNLVQIIHQAQQLKPRFGEKCNNCGWCCLTEVCQMGQYYGATTVLPCSFLISKGENHYCELVLKGTMKAKVIGIGTGCDAITQSERIEDLKNETVIHL